MRIYIAGPMRGSPDWNFPAFDAAEKAWREAGHIAFSPAKMDRALSYAPDLNTGEDRGHLEHVLLCDVAALFASDAIALLPGWEKSRGVTVELALAQFLSLKIYDAVTMKEINPPSKPWSACKTWRGVIN